MVKMEKQVYSNFELHNTHMLKSLSFVHTIVVLYCMLCRFFSAHRGL